jgi:hypothetical protein
VPRIDKWVLEYVTKECRSASAFVLYRITCAARIMCRIYSATCLSLPSPCMHRHEVTSTAGPRLRDVRQHPFDGRIPHPSSLKPPGPSPSATSSSAAWRTVEGMATTMKVLPRSSPVLPIVHGLFASRRVRHRRAYFRV